jgi:hypothetical protein
MESIEAILGPKPMNVLVPAGLFFLLTPNLWFQALPPGQSPVIQAATHAAVLAGAYYMLRQIFPQYY